MASSEQNFDDFMCKMMSFMTLSFCPLAHECRDFTSGDKLPLLVNISRRFRVFMVSVKSDSGAPYFKKKKISNLQFLVLKGKFKSRLCKKSVKEGPTSVK